MADKKISQLSSLTPALNTDELPINRSNTSGKLTVADILVPEATIRAAKDGDLTTLTTTAKTNLVSAINEVNAGLPTKIPTSYLDADTSLTANSDSKIATQKATKAYVLANVTPSATETVAGKAEVATQTETNTGTDDVRFITPLKLKTNLTTYNYLGGTGTIHYLSKYTAGTTLGISAIAQSATGNRILVNGVTDDLATTLQVSGSIRQTTITNKIAALDANGVLVVGGSGTANYITKWNATNGITSSLIQDNGTTIGVNTSPSSSIMLYVTPANTIANGIRVNNIYTGGAQAFGLIATTTGISSGTSNIGVVTSAGNNPNANFGIQSSSNTTSATANNVGGSFTAGNGLTNYAIQLKDGTEAIGKFLKCVTATNGYANWANITTADITSGLSGADTYVTRWTGTNTLAQSSLRDNGTGNIGLGNLPLSNSKLYVATNNTIYGLNASNISTTAAISFGTVSSSTGAKALQNVGVRGDASNSTTENTAVMGVSAITTIGKNVGGSFQASSGATNYAVQLKDGSQAAGKVLQCVDSDGYANWVSHYFVQTIIANPDYGNQSITINFNLGNYVIIDFTASSVATSTNAVTFTNMQQGRIYKIKVKQGTSSAGETYTPTFAGMKWPAGTSFTPTTGTGKIDFIDVWVDGVSFYGDFIKNYA
jgi:hypothetical protein